MNVLKQHGFTLKELLIVMIAIVVLVSVVLPTLSKQKYDTQYRAASEVLTRQTNDIIKFAYRRDDFESLPDTELTPAQMKQFFRIEDTDTLVNMGPIGGQRQSPSTFRVYQYVDKAAFFGPEEAPEMLAMAVHIAKAAQFKFTYHYYHADYGWDYAAGAEFVDFDDLTREYSGGKS